MTASANNKEKVLESIPVDPELLKSANWWFDASWYGILVAGAMTTIGAFLTFAFLFTQYWSSGVRERHTEWRTSALELQTANANASAAQASERAATLEVKANEIALELERERFERIKLTAKVAPRSIPQAEQEKLTAALKGFDRQVGTIKASPPLPESEWFARVLAAPLIAAGWDIKPIQGDNSNNIIAPTGVIIEYATEWSAKNNWVPTKSPAAEKLAELLNNLGIDATAFPKTLPPMQPPMTMEIIISTK